MGYKEGFSLVQFLMILEGLQQQMNLQKFLDFKQRIYIILQEKKVIIIVHSFGTLNTLNNLIYKENKDLIPKIKKFIAIGPPFA